MRKHPAVYIECNKPFGTLYTGTTCYLPERHTQHINGTASKFTAKYKLRTLVWYELHPTAQSAIDRETELKGFTRNRKLKLVCAKNREWSDLAFHLQDLR